MEKKFKILQLTIGVYVLTLICWVFILGVSIYVFPPSFEYTLIFLNNILENLMQEEPFSCCEMFYKTSTALQIIDKSYEP